MKSALDSLIEELEAGTWQVPESSETAQEAGRQRKEPMIATKGDSWSARTLDAERHFCQPHARLFPFLGRKVRTPGGPGTLLQVFANRVTVLLNSELSKCVFFRPAEIEPVSKEM